MAKKKTRRSKPGKPLSDTQLDRVAGGIDSPRLLDLGAEDLQTAAGKAGELPRPVSFKYDIKPNKSV